MVHLNAANPALPSRRRPGDHLLTGSLSTQYRSTCKICRLGIFGNDPAVWGRGQQVGLIHKSCADQAGVTYTEQPAQRPAAPGTLRSYGDTLTERQIVLVQQLADGQTIAQIAAREGINVKSVYNTLHNAKVRVDAADHDELIAIARLRGLIRRTS